MHACSIKDLNNTGHNNLKRNQDTNIENPKMWIKTRLYYRYSCIIPAYAVSCMVTMHARLPFKLEPTGSIHGWTTIPLKVLQ
jgi:hypothetical protein